MRRGLLHVLSPRPSHHPTSTRSSAARPATCAYVRIAALPVLAVALLACRGDRSFRTRAVYEAPRSALTAVVFAEGVVRAGEDVTQTANAVALFCPAGHGGTPMRLDAASAASGAATRFTIAGGTPGTLTWTFRTWSADLTGALGRAGYPPPDPAEVDELVAAIHGVAGGPKATFLTGQTHALVVRGVALGSHDPPPTLSSCTP